MRFRAPRTSFTYLKQEAGLGDQANARQESPDTSGLVAGDPPPPKHVTEQGTENDTGVEQGRGVSQGDECRCEVVEPRSQQYRAAACHGQDL